MANNINTVKEPLRYIDLPGLRNLSNYILDYRWLLTKKGRDISSILLLLMQEH